MGRLRTQYCSSVQLFPRICDGSKYAVRPRNKYWLSNFGRHVLPGKSILSIGTFQASRAPSWAVPEVHSHVLHTPRAYQVASVRTVTT